MGRGYQGRIIDRPQIVEYDDLDGELDPGEEIKVVTFGYAIVAYVGAKSNDRYQFDRFTEHHNIKVSCVDESADGYLCVADYQATIDRLKLHPAVRRWHEAFHAPIPRGGSGGGELTQRASQALRYSRSPKPEKRAADVRDDRDSLDADERRAVHHSEVSALPKPADRTAIGATVATLRPYLNAKPDPKPQPAKPIGILARVADLRAFRAQCLISGVAVKHAMQMADGWYVRIEGCSLDDLFTVIDSPNVLEYDRAD